MASSSKEKTYIILRDITKQTQELLDRFAAKKFDMDDVYTSIVGKIIRGALPENQDGPEFIVFANLNEDKNAFDGLIYERKKGRIRKHNVQLHIDLEKIFPSKPVHIIWKNDLQEKEDFIRNLEHKINRTFKNFIVYYYETLIKKSIILAINFRSRITEYDSIILKNLVLPLEFFEIAHEQYSQMEQTQIEIFNRIQMLAEKKDPETTGKHLERVRNYAKIVALELRLTPKYSKIIDDKFIQDIYNAAPLHDIGKVGIPDSILNKEGLLSKEEFEIMKKHTIIGGEVLKDSVHLKMAWEIALYHQEKYDGSGYPLGLKGDSIPLSARILALADVFDALTTQRPYKEAFPYITVKQTLINDSGKHFDPDMVKAFLKREPDFLDVLKKYPD